jgi:purine-binding chemotaxis protein CheW
MTRESGATLASSVKGVERTQLVTFRVGADQFAVDIFSVERVLRFQPPRPIPNVPAWLEGVIDYGGRVVPVIDLRARFELGAGANRDSARILVFVAGEDWIGANDELTPPPALFNGLAKQYVRWLLRGETEEEPVIIVLDVAQLLTARERIVLEQAVAGAP